MNLANSSPRFEIAMKNSVSDRRSIMFPSPGMPNYHPISFGVQNGWSSERVPLHKHANQIQENFTLRPYNNRRTLPSKWKDVEGWIIGPVAGDCALKPSLQQLQRRPKSKSGPLGPPMSGYNSMYSPVVPSFKGGNFRSFVNESPLSTRLNVDNNLSSQYQDWHEGNGNIPSLVDPYIARSVNVRCSKLLSQSLTQTTKDDVTNISCDVSRRDMPTQMSPESSPFSSPRKRNSSSLSSSTLAVVDLQHVHSSITDIRDVQLDDQVILTQKNRSRIPGRASDIEDAWKNKVSEIRFADREASEMTKSLSKVKREEAEITEWENLQKAKAEESIRKLEMKLQKKRSSSMFRIMHKLRSAQEKAQHMRESVLCDQSRQVARSSHKETSDGAE